MHPIYNLKMLYFFIIKQGFSDQHHNRAFFPFDMASLSPCNVRVLVVLRLYVWMYLLQPIKLDIFIVFILGQKLEIRCDIVCPLNHPKNMTVNGESVLHLFGFSYLSLLSFSSCNDQCFDVAHCFNHFTVCLLLVAQCGSTYTRSIPNKST